MARKKITPAPQTDVVPQAGSVQQTAADIPVQDLKDRFQARSIPLETDFWNLIDVADCGRKAAGLSPDVIPVTDTGLVLDDITGQLKVIPETDKGISVSDNGVGVVANPNGGIIVDGSGVGVLANAAKGITVESSGVGIQYDSTLQVSNNSLGVAESAFNLCRKTMFAQISTTSAITCDLLYRMAFDSSHSYARVAIMCNRKQSFVLTVNCYKPVDGGVISVAISNVYNPGDAAITGISFGQGWYHDEDLVLKLHINKNADITATYSTTDLYGIVVENLSQNRGYSAMGARSSDVATPHEIVFPF